MSGELLGLDGLVLRLHVLDVGGEAHLAVDDEPAVLRVADLGVRTIRIRATLKEEVHILLESGLTEFLRENLLALPSLIARVGGERRRHARELLRDLSNGLDVLAHRLAQARARVLRLQRDVLKADHLLLEGREDRVEMRLVQL